MADLSDFELGSREADFELPPECKPGVVQPWLHGAVTPLARRLAALA